MNGGERVNSIYLDWNVYVRFLEGKYPDLLESLCLAKKSGVLVPFSSTQIEEATKIRNTNEIINRLNFISEISDGVYFENSSKDFGLIRRSPFEVYGTLSETPDISKILKFIGNIISRPMLKATRRAMGFDPKKLNEIPPEDIWEEIDKVILNSRFAKKLPESFQESPVVGFVRYATKDSASRFGSIHESLGGVKERGEGPDITVSVLFSILETFGYFPERKKVFEKASRFNDASHCFYALWSDVCISEDRGFRMKSRAIASLVGGKAKFMDPGQAIPEVFCLFEKQ